MYASEMREMQDEELVDLFEDLKEELYKLRLNHVTGELVDTTQFRSTRRDVARILTVLHERELAATIAEGEK
ncbi:MAG: 50S ribosomal protein L29 [Anaerolineae bacterium]|nr:50S ribosomal protein L29 [Anaerolineae bacterium]MDQ7036441.1 50S ribosomal protein L29 [Anaerolineae bacterium]